MRQELGLSCSVGVARTKLVAKLASKAAKPTARGGAVLSGRGVAVVHFVDEPSFLGSQPVRALPGVGPRTAERLSHLGVSSVADLGLVGQESLSRLLGTSHGSSLFELARGIDRRRVTPARVARSIGHEQTFAEDLRDRSAIVSALRSIAADAASRCRRAGMSGRSVTLKIRYADFTTVTRSSTLPPGLSGRGAIVATAAELGQGIECHRGVRLLGVHLRQLSLVEDEPPAQLGLFDDADEGQSSRRLDDAVESVRERFGAGVLVLGPASDRSSIGSPQQRIGTGRRGPVGLAPIVTTSSPGRRRQGPGH